MPDPVTTETATPTTTTTPAATGVPLTPVAVAVSTPAISAPSSEPAKDPNTISLTTAQLRERMDRHSAKFLQDKFGTDNIDAIMASIEKSKQLEAAEDERRRASLSNEQKLQEDLKRVEARAVTAETEAKSLRQREMINKERRRVSGMATKYVDSESLELAMIKFGKAIMAMPKKQVARMQDADIDKWFKDFARANPKHSRAPVARPCPGAICNGSNEWPRPHSRASARPSTPRKHAAEDGASGAESDVESRDPRAHWAHLVATPAGRVRVL